jgi:hypothetical protein
VGLFELTKPLTAEITIAAKAHCGINLNIGVKNSREHPMMIPVTRPDRPVLASLSLFTADLEKDPVVGYAENSDPNIFATPRPNNCQVTGKTDRTLNDHKM